VGGEAFHAENQRNPASEIQNHPGFAENNSWKNGVDFTKRLRKSGPSEVPENSRDFPVDTPKPAP
jgi:hypothetical protein